MSPLHRNRSALALPVLLAVVMGAPASASADHVRDREISRSFCDGAISTQDFNQCSLNELAHEKAKLERMNAAVRNRYASRPDAGTEILAELDAADAAWEAYRKADIAARFALEHAARERGEHIGTAYYSAHAWHEARQYRARYEHLCAFLRGSAYGEQSSETCDALVDAYSTPATPSATSDGSNDRTAP